MCVQNLPRAALGADSPSVFINGIPITTQQFDELVAIDFPISDNNRYWYDAKAGLFGIENQGGWRFVKPGLDLGSLKRDVSGGDSGILINGRELSVQDAEFLTGQIGYALSPGRYWLNAAGHGGLEGGPAKFQAPRNTLANGGHPPNGDDAIILHQKPVLQERPRGSNDNGGTGATESPEGFKIGQLPRPIPKWTSRYKLPRQLLFVDDDTLGDVFDRLEHVMRQAEMYSWSAYAIHDDGFALITQLENIDKNGTPKPGKDRWDIKSESKKPLSIADYIAALLKSEPGRYRVIVFTVTHRNLETSSSEATPEYMRDLLRQGSDILPPKLRNKNIQALTRGLVFVYEFERDESTARFLDNSRLQVIDHLAAGNYWERHLLR